MYSVFEIKGAPCPGVHILAAGCTLLKQMHSKGAPFFQIRILVQLDVHMCTGCMVFSGYAPSACMISNLNFEHWHYMHKGGGGPDSVRIIKGRPHTAISQNSFSNSVLFFSYPSII